MQKCPRLLHTQVPVLRIRAGAGDKTTAFFSAQTPTPESLLKVYQKHDFMFQIMVIS